MVSNGKRKMNLGFDIDGVIADFSQALLETIKKNYGLALKKTDIYCFDLNIVLGITKSEGKQLIIEVLKKDLPLNFRRQRNLRERLSREGHNIYLLTSRYDHSPRHNAVLAKRKRRTIHSTAPFKYG